MVACQVKMASIRHPYVQARGLQRLPAALLSHTFSFLPPNERTLTARFICRDAAATLSNAEHHSASLSQPLPVLMASWPQLPGQPCIRQLPFRHKLQLLSAAARSGSEVNLEVALALLQPSVSPGSLHDLEGSCAKHNLPSDPGEAAIEAGHPQLLGWLVQHCPALLHPDRVLQAAARHCDLAGLQAVWGTIKASSFSSCCPSSGLRPVLNNSVLDAAAGSATPDAVAKMEWLLAKSRGRCRLGSSTAAAAARSGDLGRLRWLLGRGCPMAKERDELLQAVLPSADMSAVEWLVDEAGCSLLEPPEDEEEEWYWGWLVRAAACSGEGVSRVLWLQQRGVPILQASWSLMDSRNTAPFTAGEVRVVRLLQRTYGMGAEQGFPSDSELTDGAAESGSIPLVEELRQDGLEFTPMAFFLASGRGDLPMIRWLVREAKVPVADVSPCDLIELWPTHTVAHSRDLLQAVQLLVGEAGCRDWDAGEVLSAAAKAGSLDLVQYLWV